MTTINLSAEVVEIPVSAGRDDRRRGVKDLVWRLERIDTGELQRERKTGCWVPVYAVVRRTLINRVTGETIDDVWRDIEGRTRSYSALRSVFA